LCSLRGQQFSPADGIFHLAAAGASHEWGDLFDKVLHLCFGLASCEPAQFEPYREGQYEKSFG
jgi:hypothetical protein